MRSNFARNLQVLCSRVKSVSELCRELELNRQQFARYLSGASKPSPYNLGRIADYFHITVSDFDLPHHRFLELQEAANNGSERNHASLVSKVLDTATGSLEELKSFAGYYFVYLQSPSEPEKLLKSLVHLDIEGKRLISKWEEAFTRTEDGSSQTSRYEGVVRCLNGYLFIVDIETSMRDTILETVLQVPYRRKYKILTGLTMGMTTGRQRLAFASIAVFQFLGKKIDWAPHRSQCGFFDFDSKNIDRAVSAVFAQQEVSHIYPKVFSRL